MHLLLKNKNNINNVFYLLPFTASQNSYYSTVTKKKTEKKNEKNEHDRRTQLSNSNRLVNFHQNK